MSSTPTSDGPAHKRPRTNGGPNRGGSRGRGNSGGFRGRGGTQSGRGGFAGGLDRHEVAQPAHHVAPAEINIQPVIPVGPSTATQAPFLSGSSHLSDKKFSDFPIGTELIRRIKFEHCTEVQALTLGPILAGEDIMAQAKTGTGKTLAFLIPAVQSLLAGKRPPKGQSTMLVLSPTRELALQTADAARKLIEGTDIGVTTLIGGTNVQTDLKNLANKKSDILIATPGRTLDLIDNYNCKGRLEGIKFLVLDEADQLMQQGFQRDILRINDSLPSRQTHPRQTLFFSATIPNDVKKVAEAVLLHGYKSLSTLKPEDQHTHKRVNQRFAYVEPSLMLPLGLKLIQDEQRSSPQAWKIMCFLPTARATQIAAAVYEKANVENVLCIHSRLSQSARTKINEAFHQAKTGILFSTDVSARGIDIPGVTFVIQMNAPVSGDQYLHRLGRTARAGAEGSGTLLLWPNEKFFLQNKEVKNFGLLPMEGETPNLANQLALVNQALDNIDDELKSQVYGAHVGYFKGNAKGMGFSPEALVSHSNDYALNILRYKGNGDGRTPPPMMKQTIGKMGLKGVSGFNIVAELPGKSSGGGGGGGRGGHGSGGRGGKGGRGVAGGHRPQGGSFRRQGNGE